MFPLDREALAELDERDAGSPPPIPSRAFARGKEDCDKHGLSRACLGCRALSKGKMQKKHAEECRKRMEHEMRSSARVQQAKARSDEFLEAALRREDAKGAERPTPEEAGICAGWATATDISRQKAALADEHMAEMTTLQLSYHPQAQRLG